MVVIRETHRYSSAPGTTAWWNSIDLYGDPDALRPIFLFVGGGGWQGLDHVNDHAKLAKAACAQGFAVAIARHRPARVRMDGLLPLLLLGLVVPFGCWRLSLAIALATELFNRHRRAAPLPSTVLDVAHAVAFVLRNERVCAAVGGDSHRVVLCGNSSGGHLLSLVALDPRWLATLAAPTAPPACQSRPSALPLPRPTSSLPRSRRLSASAPCPRRRTSARASTCLA